MGIDGISSIGHATAYTNLLTGSEKLTNKLNANDKNSFQHVINTMLVEQLTSTLFSGEFFGAGSEYAYLMQDTFSTLLSDQFNLIGYEKLGDTE